MTERLFILAPTVVFRARVNLASATYPIITIPYDGVTVGSSLVIKSGMTLLLGSSSGADDYGRQRVRSANVSEIKVGRTSQGVRDGELNVVDDAYITILDDHRIWPRTPYIDFDGNIFKDGDIAPIGFTESPPPIANAGIGFAGSVSTLTGLATVQFSATASLQFDTTVAATNLSTPPTFLWNVKDGTITVGTNTSSAITATFPSGFRWVELKVTSDTTMKETIRYIPVFTRDDNTNPSILNFHIESQVRTSSGQELVVNIFDSLPLETYPEGTLVMLWDDAEQVSTVDRTHVKFIGWMSREQHSVGAAPTMSDVGSVIRCVDVAGRLKELPAFTQEMIYDATPVTWGETQFNRVFYYIWYLLHWHSTALEVSDLIATSQTIATFEFLRFSSDEGSLWEQAARAATRVIPDHHLTCNDGGQLQVVVDPMIQNVADRSATIVQTISDSDWFGIEFSRNRSPRVYQLLAWAIENSSTDYTPMRSKAPGDAIGHGYQYVETSEHIADNQFDLNQATGNRYARLNAPYERFTITMPYELLDAAVDPADMKWVTLVISAENAVPRGLSLPSGSRGIVHEINVTREYAPTGLIRTVTLSWELETSGQPGILVQEY